MIELTFEQRQDVIKQGEIPPRAIDSDTVTTYVLIRQEVYAKIQALLIEEQNNQFLHDMYRPVMETFGKDDYLRTALKLYPNLNNHKFPIIFGVIAVLVCDRHSLKSSFFV